MQPSIGRIVHYVSHGTPRGEFASECRAAIVTEVELLESKILGGERVGLCVFNPTGLFFHSLADGGCRYHEGGIPDQTRPNVRAYPGGTWHWPERVEELTAQDWRPARPGEIPGELVPGEDDPLAVPPLYLHPWGPEIATWRLRILCGYDVGFHVKQPCRLLSRGGCA